MKYWLIILVAFLFLPFVSADYVSWNYGGGNTTAYTYSGMTHVWFLEGDGTVSTAWNVSVQLNRNGSSVTRTEIDVYFTATQTLSSSYVHVYLDDCTTLLQNVSNASSTSKPYFYIKTLAPDTLYCMQGFGVYLGTENSTTYRNFSTLSQTSSGRGGSSPYYGGSDDIQLSVLLEVNANEYRALDKIDFNLTFENNNSQPLRDAVIKYSLIGPDGMVRLESSETIPVLGVGVTMLNRNLSLPLWAEMGGWSVVVTYTSVGLQIEVEDEFSLISSIGLWTLGVMVFLLVILFVRRFIKFLARRHLKKQEKKRENKRARKEARG